MLKWFSAIHDSLPPAVLVNALLTWGLPLESIKFLPSSQIRIELLTKINVKKKV